MPFRALPITRSARLALLLAVALVAAQSLALAAVPDRASATPPSSTPGTYTAVSPTRILDTRGKLGGATPGARGVVHLPVLGAGPVPASGVSAVVLNVTVVTPASSGYLTVWGDGAPRPVVSNLNFTAGRTVANLVVAPVGANGKVAFYNGSGGGAPLLADVAGYYAAGTPTAAGSFARLSPSRLLDTRSGVGGTTPAPKQVLALQVTGRGGVPHTGVSAVVLNVTVVNPAAGGYVTAYGAGTARPTASNLNFVAGQTVPNLVVAPVGAGGRVALYNGSPGRTPLLADVAGYVLAGSPALRGAFVPLPPSRLLDTRSGTGATTPGPRGTIHVPVTGRGGVPLGNVSAVVLNVTAAAPRAGGYVTVWGDGTARPTVSNVNFVAGQTVPNLVVAPLGANGSIALYNGSGGSTPLIADVAGYVLAAPVGAIGGTVTRSDTSAALAGVAVDVFDQSGNEVGTAATAANGKYTVTGLAASSGGYVVCFDAGNATGGPFADECHANRPWDGFSNPPSGTTLVPVTAGSTSTVNAALDSSQGIAGTVTATGGAPLAGVAVTVYAGSVPKGAVTTTASGTYALALATGSYTVCFDASSATGGPSLTGYRSECFADVAWGGGSAARPGGLTAVAVTAGQVHGGVDATLAGASLLQGVLTSDTGGSALDGVVVRVYDGVGTLVATATTAGGSYSIGGLAAGVYQVCFDGSNATGGPSLGGYLAECLNAVNVADGAAAVADAGLASAAAVTGKVLNGLTGVPGVAVTVFDTTGTVLGTVATGASGSYDLGGLPAGAVTVCIDPSGATGAPSTGWVAQCTGGVLWDTLGGVPAIGALTVPLTAGLAAVANLTLVIGGKLAGKITENGSGLALGDVDVYLFAGGAQVLHTTTAANGTWALPGVLVGVYTLCFDATFATGGTSPSGNYASECYLDRPWNADPGSLPALTAPVAAVVGVLTNGLNAGLADA